MGISDEDRRTIGQIVSIIQEAQDGQGGNAQAVLGPRVDSIVSTCREMAGRNPEVLAFVADLMNTANRWALGDWSDGTVTSMSESVWDVLANHLNTIPGIE